MNTKVINPAEPEIPKTKLQIPNKSQLTKAYVQIERVCRFLPKFGISDSGDWIFFGIWLLPLGIFKFCRKSTAPKMKAGRLPAALLLVLFAGLGVAEPVFAQDCETALDDALEAFDQQLYEQTARILAACPADSLPDKNQKIRAFELLALSYAELNNQAMAIAALHSLLDIFPGYTPKPPKYAASYIQLVENIRKEKGRQKPAPAVRKSLFRKRWFWIGGIGLAASTLAAAIIFKTNSAANRLPDPPVPPYR